MAHAKRLEHLLKELDAAPGGLTGTEAAARLARDGYNELTPPKQTGLPGRLVKQLADPMILLLLVSAGLSLALGGGETDSLRPYPGTPLRRGSAGEDVRWLQTMLNAVSTVDLDMPMLAVDGVFGPATEANVRRYQRNYGLAEDGIAGPLTWESLTKEYARITGAS